MKYLLFLIFSLLVLLTSCQEKTKTSRTILAVVAHPDDETTITPILAKYAKTDSVYLIITTDGRFGITDHAGIPSGDSLVNIRLKEAACSCEKLGINPPIHLGLQDGMGMNGHGNFYEQEAMLKERLLKEINQIRPDIILTFGPDGDTGHPDHRMTGLITTELVLRENLVEDIDIYYYGWTAQDRDKFDWWNLNYAAEEIFDTVISFSDEDEAKSYEAIRCYVSQFQKEEMEKWIQTELDDKSNVLHFRKFALEPDIKNDF